MPETVRVVMDLSVADVAAIKPRELAFHVALAVEQYQREQHPEGPPIVIEAIRIPDPTQTFLKARELFDEEALTRWKNHRPPRG